MFLSIAGERTSNDALVENDPAILHVRGLFSSYEYIKENFFFGSERERVTREIGTAILPAKYLVNLKISEKMIKERH